MCRCYLWWAHTLVPSLQRDSEKPGPYKWKPGYPYSANPVTCCHDLSCRLLMCCCSPVTTPPLGGSQFDTRNQFPLTNISMQQVLFVSCSTVLSTLSLYIACLRLLVRQGQHDTRTRLLANQFMQFRCTWWQTVFRYKYNEPCALWMLS